MLKNESKGRVQNYYNRVTETETSDTSEQDDNEIIDVRSFENDKSAVTNVSSGGISRKLLQSKGPSIGRFIILSATLQITKLILEKWN